MDKADLAKRLPELKLLADEWAERNSQLILASGRSLGGREPEFARFLGVQHPEKVRILVVPSIPKPDHPVLLAAAEEVDYLGPGTIGLTLFYGIYLVKSHEFDVETIFHELRHVYQYEQAGSIPAFLGTYLPELLQYENNSPSEVDARAWAAKGIAILQQEIEGRGEPTGH